MHEDTCHWLLKNFRHFMIFLNIIKKHSIDPTTTIFLRYVPIWSFLFLKTKNTTKRQYLYAQRIVCYSSTVLLHWLIFDACYDIVYFSVIILISLYKSNIWVINYGLIFLKTSKEFQEFQVHHFYKKSRLCLWCSNSVSYTHLIIILKLWKLEH